LGGGTGGEKRNVVSNTGPGEVLHDGVSLNYSQDTERKRGKQKGGGTFPWECSLRSTGGGQRQERGIKVKKELGPEKRHRGKKFQQGAGKGKGGDVVSRWGIGGNKQGEPGVKGKRTKGGRVGVSGETTQGTIDR